MDILLDGAGGEEQNIERRVDQKRVERKRAKVVIWSVN